MAQTFSETVRDRFDDVIHLHYSFLCDTTQTVTCQQLALMAILSFLSSFLYWIGFGIWIWWGRGETGAGDSWRFLEILGDSWRFLVIFGWAIGGVSCIRPFDFSLNHSEMADEICGTTCATRGSGVFFAKEAGLNPVRHPFSQNRRPNLRLVTCLMEWRGGAWRSEYYSVHNFALCCFLKWIFITVNWARLIESSGRDNNLATGEVANHFPK